MVDITIKAAPAIGGTIDLKLYDLGGGIYSFHPPITPATTPGGLQSVSATLTRPANTTAYAQGDLIADSTSAAAATEIEDAVRAAGESFRWEGARLKSSNTGAKGKTFRAYLWSAVPTLSVHDNGAFNASQTLAVSDVASLVGYIDITLTEAGTASAVGRANLAEPRTAGPASGTSLWVTFEQRDSSGYTPISGETFNITLEGQWS